MMEWVAEEVEVAFLVAMAMEEVMAARAGEQATVVEAAVAVVQATVVVRALAVVARAEVEEAEAILDAAAAWETVAEATDMVM